MIAEPDDIPLVHLLAPPSRSASAWSSGRIVPTILCAESIRASRASNSVILVGDRSARASANAMGIPAHTLVTPVRGTKGMLVHAIRRLIPQGARLICWSDELFAVGSKTDPNAQLVSTSPTQPTTLSGCSHRIRVPNARIQSVWESRKHHATIDHGLSKLLQRFTPISTRSEIRNKLRVDDQTLLLSAVADHPSTIDAKEFTYLLGHLASVGYTTAGIVPSCARNINNARRHHRGLRCPFRLIIADDPFPLSLPAADLAVHSDHADTTPAALFETLCNAAAPGVPVLSYTTDKRARSSDVSIPIMHELDRILSAKPIATP